MLEVTMSLVTVECSTILTVRRCSAPTSATCGWRVGQGRVVIVMGLAQILVIPGGRGGGQVIKSNSDGA